jgi:hypothetical protein
MSSALVVFDPGGSSLSSPSTYHAPRDHITVLTSPRNQDDQGQHHLFSSRQPLVILPALLCPLQYSAYAPLPQKSHPTIHHPPPPIATAMKWAPLHTSSLFQWLPTPCLFVVAPPMLVVFPGSLIILPAPLLTKQLPYI